MTSSSPAMHSTSKSICFTFQLSVRFSIRYVFCIPGEKLKKCMNLAFPPVSFDIPPIQQPLTQPWITIQHILSPHDCDLLLNLILSLVCIFSNPPHSHPPRSHLTTIIMIIHFHIFFPLPPPSLPPIRKLVISRHPHRRNEHQSLHILLGKSF